MGRIFELHEIINTPEARGMMTIPSSQSVSVKFGDLKAKRELRLHLPHPVPGGWEFQAEDFSQIKADASSKSAVAFPWELLQIDPEVSGQDDNMPPGVVTEFAGLDDTNWMPPDSQIAVGSEHVIATINATFAILDKLGRQLIRRTFADVFARLVEDAIIYNPKVIYDHFHDSWLIAACARSVDWQRSWFLIASSQTEDPLGTWKLWALDAGCDGANRTTHWPENLGVSVDNDHLYLTANMFNGQNEFAYAKLRVLSVREIQSGGVLHGWDFWHLRNADGSPAFGLQPAINLRAAGAQYLLNAAPDGSGLTQWTVSTPLRQAPNLTRRFIPTAQFHTPPDVSLSNEIKTSIGDARLANVVFRHGLLWTAHTIAANWDSKPNTAAIHWIQINPRAGCVMQQGIYGAPERHYFCPAVMVDGEANMLLVFNRASESEPPSIRFTGRKAVDENGLLQASELLFQSSTSASGEWSRCNGAAMMPDDSTVWLIGQYVATDTDWPTWIGAVSYAESGEETKDLYPSQFAFR